MVKNGSVSSASGQLTSSSSLSSLSSEANSGEITITRCSQGSVSNSDINMASRGSSQKVSVSQGSEHAQYSDHYPPSLHHLQKLDFTHHLIWVSSFHSLSGILGSPLLSLSSSRAISIFDRKNCQIVPYQGNPNNQGREGQGL